MTTSLSVKWRAATFTPSRSSTTRHRAQALGLALYVTKQATVAEEVTQDAFLGLWRSAASFDPQRAAVRTWLLSMVRNRAIDALRKHAKQLRDVEFDESIAERLECPDRPDEQLVQAGARALTPGISCASSRPSSVR